MKTFAVALLLAVLVAAEAADAAGANRKLAQWGNNRRRRDYPNSADAQFARNQAAQINTQGAIRGAVESGANPYAVRGATNVGSANAYLAAQGSNWVFGPNVVTNGRKLAQWGNNRRRRDYPDAQFARNQAAQINTQGAIRGAVESGANPYAVRGATNVGSANAYLAAQRSNWVFGPNVVNGKKL